MTPPSFRRLFHLATGRDRDAVDREAELDLHLALATEELIAQGVPPDQARRTAEQRFGDRERVATQVRAADREGARAIRRREGIARWLTDARRAGRGFLREPSFSLAAVTLIALGLGGNVAVFTAVNAAFFHPLPYPDADRIVTVHETQRGGAMRVASRNFHDWVPRRDLFANLAMYSEWERSLAGAERPETRVIAVVSHSFAAVLGLSPVVGRWFALDESRLGGPPVVVVSERYWRNRLGADPKVVGRQLRIDGVAMTIVGVMPVAFDFPVGVDGWVPAEPFDENPNRTAHNWNVVGRLAPGLSVGSATASLGELTRQIVAEEPRSEYVADGVRLTPFRERLLGESPTLLILLQVAVGMLFLIAVFNLVALFLARSAKRGPEISMMMTLGAERADLIRRFVIEALVITLVGTAVGLAGWLALRPFLLEVLGTVTPFVRSLPLDWKVVAFAVAAILSVAMLGGYLPAVWVRRAVERGGARHGSRVTGPGGVMRALVAVEVAATFALLVGSGLLGRSLNRLLAVDLGFETTNRVIVQLSLPTAEGSPYVSGSGQLAFFDRLMVRARQLPGVTAVAVTSAAPLIGVSPNGSARIQGEPSDAGGPAATSDFRVVSPGFFAVAGIPLIGGRDLDPTDAAASPYVVVVNEAFSKQHLRGEDPLGRQVRFPGMDAFDRDRWATVVGVVGDVRLGGPSDEVAPAIYYSTAQRPQIYRSHALMVQVARDPASVIAPLRHLVGELDPNLPVDPIEVDDALQSVTAIPRLRTITVGLFALGALVLAGAGLFGVVGFVLTGRSRELGVRSALGATAARLAGTAAREALGPVVIGILVGASLSALLGRLVAGLLYGVEPNDPLTFVGAAAVLVGVALAATAGPIRRAIRTDPIFTLRSE